MNQILQYRPNFIQVDEDPELIDFAGKDELLAIPFVRKFRDGIDGQSAFHRYSVAAREGAPHLLMAEYDDGFIWWVIGFLREVVDELPPWRPRYREMNGTRNENWKS